MTIEMLNSVTFAPRIAPVRVGGVCLVVERDQGLVLVDNGLGVHDYVRPTRMVRFLRRFFGIPKGEEQAIVRQLERRGTPAQAVTHIVQTHLHFDHAGGVADFPHAQVHVHRREYEAMRRPRKPIEIFCDKQDFAHGPKWAFYERVDAEWYGLPAIRLPLSPEMLLVPLFGHTSGHCGVAIRDGEGWVLACGDAIILPEMGGGPGVMGRLAPQPHAAKLLALARAHREVRLAPGHLKLPWKDGPNPPPLRR